MVHYKSENEARKAPFSSIRNFLEFFFETVRIASFFG